MIPKQLEEIKCLVSNLEDDSPIKYYVREDLNVLIDSIHAELAAQEEIKLIKMREGSI
jgi:hypothetical protein